MLDLVENPEDRFSHNEAHLVTESVLMGSILFRFPEHALCSNDNGGCSDFCLPNEAGGRTCACEEYTELLVDEKTCESRKYCRFRNLRKNLIFANICEFVASRIQSKKHDTFISCLVEK